MKRYMLISAAVLVENGKPYAPEIKTSLFSSLKQARKEMLEQVEIEKSEAEEYGHDIETLEIGENGTHMVYGSEYTSDISWEIIDLLENMSGKQIVYTLVRTHCFRESSHIDGANEYVSRSFTKLDNETASVIRACIKEDAYDEELYASIEEFDGHYVFDLADLACLECQDEDEINHEGQLIWEDRNDEDDLIQYILHTSLIKEQS